eukprot:TRINITY_DN12596_c0_g1_i1.p1 TRINITY_DN12596_c0_g1~~TRINITY_DN12596_c0_g1_i1.p1  ORF type:complete len:264 (-),score=94.42 TRINITY_DN12596_c0_g1_i1:167-958(-)
MEPAEGENVEEATDDEFDFDAIATRAVVAVGMKPQAALTGHLKKAKELGLQIDLGEEHLYLTGKSRKKKKQKAFDTAVAANDGSVRLEFSDFSEGLAPEPPAGGAATREREVRGAPVRPVDDRKLRNKAAKEMRESRLDKWFGMKKQQLNPDLEKELKAIKLRGNVDPKRFYKGNDTSKLPEYFAVATEVRGGMRPTGFEAHQRSGRGGQSFLESVLQDSKAQEWTWKKTGEVMDRTSVFSGHGKRGISGKQRGGAWKKTKKS